MRVRRWLWLEGTLVGLLVWYAAACEPGNLGPGVLVSTPEPEASGVMSVALRAEDAEGEPISIRRDATVVVVEARAADTEWEVVEDVEVVFSGPYSMDVALVADNSGSEAGKLPEIQAALRAFAQRVLTRSPLDRVGLVRVSPEATILQPLTESLAAVEAAIDELFIANGWTALWDGVRQANEVLAAGVVVQGSPDPLSLCVDRSFRAIVLFTDGRENNSADEHLTRYEGDGVDTKLGDLLLLDVAGSPTPIHVAGVGEEIDVTALEQLAAATNGTFVHLAHHGELHGALQSTASQLENTVPVCFRLARCDYSQVRITVRVDLSGTSVESAAVFDLNSFCD